jgi:hypothetical protein
MERINKSSFKVDSEIYLYLSNFINNSPIDEKTQREIEMFLINYSYMSLKNDQEKNKSIFTIDYKLFGDKKIKDFILESYQLLNDYLNNFKKKNFNMAVKRVNLKTKSRHHFKQMLEVIDNSIIIEIALGMFARIVSNLYKISNNCTLTNISYEMGDTIVKNYFYSLYKIYMIEGFTSFLKECESFLNSEVNNLNKEDFDTIQKYITDIKKGLNILELYQIKNLISKILDVNGLGEINFNDTESIVDYSLSD